MTLSLSTNWCNRRIANGREIAIAAKALGFGELELGFHTTEEQAREISESGVLPIGSVHAFCPVPLSAPCGYPELYQLASFDEEGRAMARFQVVKNIRFAASVGADALVLHAGRIRRGGLFKARRSRKLVEIMKRELGTIGEELEKSGVTLGLENMPYAEGFPNGEELKELAGERVKAWWDTGHAFVMGASAPESAVGMHINDSKGGDDHLPPGEGKVDFAALKGLVAGARHVVFEPNDEVSEERLAKGMEFFKRSMA